MNFIPNTQEELRKSHIIEDNYYQIKYLNRDYFNGDENIEKTKAIGMQEHLNKPIEVEKLYSTLLKYISKKVDNKKVQVLDDGVFLPYFKNINTSIGLEYVNMNKKLYLKILNSFYTDYHHLNIENLNDEEFSRTIHTLKGLSSNIGALELNEVSIELEDTLNQELIQKFEEKLHNVLVELEEKLNTSKLVSNTILLELSDSLRDELFLKLKDAVNTKRPKNCNTVIKEIESYTLNNKDQSVFDNTKIALTKFDFKKAIEILQ